MPSLQTQEPCFTNHGMAANAAEQRGVVAISTADGLLSKAILELDTAGSQHSVVARPPSPITAGGGLANDMLCYAAGTDLWSLCLPPG